MPSRSIPHVSVEQLLLIANRRHNAAGMGFRKITHHLSEHFQANEKPVERILVKFIGTSSKPMSWSM